MAFYDLQTPKVPPLPDIAAAPIAFRLWVMKYAIGDGVWPVLGHLPLEPWLLEHPWFFKEDSFSGHLTKTRTGDEEEPVSRAEAAGLERAAVWSPEHVVERLKAHLSGRPSAVAERLTLRT